MISATPTGSHAPTACSSLAAVSQITSAPSSMTTTTATGSTLLSSPPPQVSSSKSPGKTMKFPAVNVIWRKNLNVRTNPDYYNSALEGGEQKKIPGPVYDAFLLLSAKTVRLLDAFRPRNKQFFVREKTKEVQRFVASVLLEVVLLLKQIYNGKNAHKHLRAENIMLFTPRMPSYALDETVQTTDIHKHCSVLLIDHNTNCEGIEGLDHCNLMAMHCSTLAQTLCNRIPESNATSEVKTPKYRISGKGETLKPWMAPEMLSPSQKHDPKTDIWALGIMALELWFSYGLFERMDGAETDRRLKGLQEGTLSIDTMMDALDKESELVMSTNFAAFVKGCLVADPNKRFSLRRAQKELSLVLHPEIKPELLQTPYTLPGDCLEHIYNICNNVVSNQNLYLYSVLEQLAPARLFGRAHWRPCVIMLLADRIEMQFGKDPKKLDLREKEEVEAIMMKEPRTEEARRKKKNIGVRSLMLRDVLHVSNVVIENVDRKEAEDKSVPMFGFAVVRQVLSENDGNLISDCESFFFRSPAKHVAQNWIDTLKERRRTNPRTRALVEKDTAVTTPRPRSRAESNQCTQIPSSRRLRRHATLMKLPEGRARVWVAEIPDQKICHDGIDIPVHYSSRFNHELVEAIRSCEDEVSSSHGRSQDSDNKTLCSDLLRRGIAVEAKHLGRHMGRRARFLLSCKRFASRPSLMGMSSQNFSKIDSPLFKVFSKLQLENAEATPSSPSPNAKDAPTELSQSNAGTSDCLAALAVDLPKPK